MSGAKDPMAFGGACPACGKLRFASRAAAKRGIRQMRGAGRGGGHLNAYRCGEFWHIGNLPPSVAAGEESRADLRRRPA